MVLRQITPPSPLSCVLVTTPTNAHVDNLLSQVHDECYAQPVVREMVLGDHPASRLRLRAQQAAAIPALQSLDQNKGQETVGNTPGWKPTMTCALISRRVVFATARMVANRHRLLLGAAPGRPQTRFALSFLDEASGHNILVGWDLPAMGSQCLPGHLRPYNPVHLLASACRGNPKAKDVPCPTEQTFTYNNVDMQSPGPMCTAMIHNGSAPLAPCNSFCTACGAVPASSYNSTR